MQIRAKKLIKFITLAICAALIATVSANIYKQMYIQGSGSITTGGLSWAKGTSAPSGAVISGVTVQNLNLSILADTPENFTDCLRLINNDATAHSFNVSSAVTAGDVTKFSAFNMVVYSATGSRIGTINILTGGSATGMSIAGSQTLYVRFEVVPLTGATSGYVAFTITLTYV